MPDRKVAIVGTYINVFSDYITEMDLLVVIGSLAVGLMAGILSAMFGIGGAMFLIPAFRIFFGMTGHEAIATTIPLTIPTALVGAYNFHLKGMVKVKTALLAGFVGGAFSFAGAYMTGFFDSSALMWSIAFLFGLLAYFSWKRADEDKAKWVPIEEKAYRTAFIGSVGGFLKGFFGIGGGAVVVPLLIRIRYLSMATAVPTSLAIISIYSITSTAAHMAIGNIVFEVLVPVMLGSIVGVSIMARHVGSQDNDLRQKAFVVFILLMAVIIIGRELLFV